MKKGFTLIEVLGVIVILSVIGLIVTSLIQGLVNNSSEKICEYQEKIYKKAAKNYVANNPFNVPEEITLQQLIDEGYLEKNQIKCGSVEDVIKITPNYIEEGKIKNYSYEYMPIDGESSNNQELEENAVYAINTNTITKNLSTLQDIGTTYKSCIETGKRTCLRYKIENNLVKNADICFVYNNTEYCISGADRNEPISNETYVNNKTTLINAFGSANCNEETHNEFNDLTCSTNSWIVNARSNSENTYAYDGAWTCYINSEFNWSYCSTIFD